MKLHSVIFAAEPMGDKDILFASDYLRTKGKKVEIRLMEQRRLSEN